MPAGVEKKFRTNLDSYAVTVLGKLQAFAIIYVEKEVTKILEQLRDVCPPQEVLAKLSNTVNTLRKVLANINKQIDKVDQIGKFLDPVLLGAQVYIVFQKNRIDFLATPIEGPAGTPTFARTKGEINRMTSKLNRFEDLVETVEDAQFAIKAATVTAKGVFIPIEATLNILDRLIQRCASSENLSDEERSNLLKEINSNTEQIYFRGISYRSESGKDYTLKVINDPTSPIFAPKRQAIAQDFRGITVLTGPSSFASDPQVLIEELKFRIENQLP